MSDLQIALLLIGGFIVFAVLLFNWVQERRYKKQADAAFQPVTRDVLLEKHATPKTATRIEPGLREPESRRETVSREVIQPGTKSVPQATLNIESASAMRPPHTTPATPAKIVPATLAPVPAAPYDELIEYRVRVEGMGISGSVFTEDMNVARSLGRITRWLGYPQQGSEWEEIQAWRDTLYREVQVSMQLADRNGGVQADELDRLCAVLTATAQQHGLKIVCDDIAEALERAQSVDHFCVDVDVLIGLNVVAQGEGTMKLPKIIKEVEACGMMLGVDGAYRLLDSRGESLYSLCNHDAEPFSPTDTQPETQGVTLQFDVPRVPDGLKVFDSMVSFGRKLANEAGGLLVDDNMRPLTDSGIDKIRQQLAGIYQRMEARGVPPGSRRALRLFS
ncbi:MAG: cell division protein ZipA C-terminal FtsZ-binding domain-containing protein [Thiobacillus sp.]